jgi:iron complex transport system substrate-binding protein
MRIASLVPSATEMLFALGAGDRVVAVTHECDWPPKAAALPHLTRSVIPSGLPPAEIDAAVRATLGGGAALYELDREELARLDPELIVTQAVCEVCAVSYGDVVAVAATLPSRPGVISLDPLRLEDVLADVTRLGGAIGAPDAAAELRADLERRIEAVGAAVSGAPRPRTLALEWLDPPFVGGHWVPQMIAIGGGEDALAKPGERSRTAEWPELRQAQAEVAIVMPCGYDLEGAVEEAHAYADSLRSLGASSVFAVDASSFFSRPGPRLVEGIELVGRLLHPDRFPERAGPAAVRIDDAGQSMRAEGLEPPRAKPTSS